MKFLVTAGPTREPIDAVRFISNRSSGRMGLEIALAAAQLGHEVTLLLGLGSSVTLDRAEQPPNLRVHRFNSSVELKQLLDAHFPDHDVLVMAAAVADHRPATVVDGKLPRGDQPLTLQLQPTPDLLALTAERKRSNQFVVAFALEAPAQLETRALEKLHRKKADAIVANPLSTMEDDEISATWLTAAGGRLTLPRMSKPRFARWLVEEIASAFAPRPSPP